MMKYVPVDFDIDDFLSRIQGNKPPFICPAETCHKIHKSYSHMQKHMLIHRPPAPIDIPAKPADLVRATEVRGFPTQLMQCFEEDLAQAHLNKTTTSMLNSDPRWSVVFGPSSVTEGQTFRCNIFVSLTFRVEDRSIINSHTVCPTTAYPLRLTDTPTRSIGRIQNKMRTGVTRSSDDRDQSFVSENLVTRVNEPTATNQSCPEGTIETKPNPPVPVFEVDPDFSFKKPLPVKESHGFIRFIEKSSDELDEVVEYDLDEEDLFWLDRINKRRKQESLPPVREETLEWVIDRFEKEAKFRLISSSNHSTQDPYSAPSTGHSGIDEDAVCAVCQDGTCENTNVILFCDVCNLAVHQECYGVPYVPEGPWLCRKCLHSPSEPVSCVLCPNRGGAFKKTADDRWAHVICGLWVPEVMFANLTFLEPLEGIDDIAPARWRLQCFICKQRNVGACIQCHKSSCYRAFHVTCAQHAGLYMKIEHTDDPGDAGIRKNAFCDQHCPPNHFTGSNTGMYANSDSESPQSAEQVARIQLRKARKVLAERRNSKPSICVPIVPQAKTEMMAAKLTDVSGDVMNFLRQAYSFWKLKRELRRGVPLLKRLQASSVHRSAASFAAAASSGDAEAQRMRSKLQFWQRLRQNLEKARLLSELTRKRERVKRDIFRTLELEMGLQLNLLDTFLLRLLDQLLALDKHQFFAEPVGSDLAPDYYLIIKNPMDFSTMRKKIEDAQYSTISEFQSDYHLMLNNCFRYNRRDSIYYTAATRMLEQGKQIFEDAFSIAERIGLLKRTGLTPSVIPLAKEEPPSEDPSKLKENGVYIPVSSDHAVTNEGSRVIRPHEQRTVSSKSHSPPKEFANGSPDISVSSSTRSRLRNSAFASANHVKVDGPKLNGYLNPIELPVRRRRKRRPSPDSMLCTTTTDGRKKMRQDRINFTPTSRGDDNLCWHAESPVTTGLFSSKIPSHPATNLMMKTLQWSNVDSFAEAANPLLRHMDSRHGKNDATDMNGVTRNGPAFTHYRHSPVVRYEEEEEEEDSSDEESSDDGNNQIGTANGTRQNADIKRAHLRTRSETSPLVSTTVVVGNSRMACVSSRRRPQGSSGRAVKNLCTNSVIAARKASNARRNRHSRADRKRPPLSSPISKPNEPSRSHTTNWTDAASRTPISEPTNDTLTVRVPHVEEVPKSPQLREAASSSLTNDLSDGCSHVESPGPLSTSTSIEPQEFFHQSSDAHSAPGSPCSRMRFAGSGSFDAVMERPLNPLDVVWAKCRGSPWYPGLIVDAAATEGYSHNGVPVPLPPDSVLKWGKQIISDGNTSDQHRPELLVLFFDTKRTWQWLPRYKLHILGFSADVDRERLREGRRSKMKNSVTKAYRRAVEHLCKVHGRPYPYSDNSKFGELPIFTI